jgi:hypothetical protein
LLLTRFAVKDEVRLVRDDLFIINSVHVAHFGWLEMGISYSVLLGPVDLFLLGLLPAILIRPLYATILLASSSTLV